MPSFNIVKKSEINSSFRNNRVKSDFDLDVDNIVFEAAGNIDVNLDSDDWQIGAIVGNSGTGKSTIARNLFDNMVDADGLDWGEGSIIEEMPDECSVKEITKTFTSVGFSSPPSWLKPYSVLSQGEKMRADLAKAILKDNQIIAFDEFTSVVDRDVAKTMSMASKKAISRSNKKLVVITCHFDILDWLEPDWVFNTNDMSTKKKPSGKGRNCSFRSRNVQEKNGINLGSITI